MSEQQQQWERTKNLRDPWEPARRVPKRVLRRYAKFDHELPKNIYASSVYYYRLRAAAEKTP